MENLVGERFGKLVVNEYVTGVDKNRPGLRFVICECDCGKTTHPIRPRHLKIGKTKSCGCYRDHYKEMSGSKSVLFKGHKEIRGHTWNEFKRSAARRNIPFDITIEQGWKKYEKQERRCRLSGVPIEFGNAVKSGISKETTASLDRIDNDGSYTTDNIQWVHKDVNIMRNKMSVDRFLELCQLIVENNQGDVS